MFLSTCQRVVAQNHRTESGDHDRRILQPMQNTNRPPAHEPQRLALLGTHPPRKCGIELTKERSATASVPELQLAVVQ